MGTYSTLTDQPIDIHLGDDWYDDGWSISGGRATHNSCNSGIIVNSSLVTVAGERYKVRFTVVNWESGVVTPIVGGVLGTPVSAVGTYEEEIEAQDSSGLKFFSDGDLTIELIRVSHGEIPAVTFSFDPDTLKWVSYWSYSPDMMGRFLDQYVSWKDGEFWVHNKNEVRNSFYGNKYPSQIVFYCNVNYDQDKDFYSLIFNGSSPWSAEVELPPRHGKSKGQRSRIKIGDFKFEKGRWVGAFRRDMNDPRFSDELQALMRGAYLQGQYMKVTITNNNDDPMELATIEIDVSTK